MSEFNLHCYDDIINLPHHVSKKHPPMKKSDRAAQFGSFAALTGHSDAIEETGRLTLPKYEPSEYIMQVLDAKLQFIKENIETLSEIKVTYFEPDEFKSGGSYVVYKGKIRRIDEVNKVLIFENDKQIQIDMLYDIESDLIVFSEELNYL